MLQSDESVSISWHVLFAAAHDVVQANNTGYQGSRQGEEGSRPYVSHKITKEDVVSTFRQG
jgi:hypothetical protein